MNDEVRQSVMSPKTWVRGLYMLLFALIYQLAELVIAFVCLFQFVTKLFTGETNERLLDFGEEMTAFIQQILQFQTFNTEYKPFPLNPWPGIDLDDAEAVIIEAEEVQDTEELADAEESEKPRDESKQGDDTSV